jgi:hypothetical protein
MKSVWISAAKKSNRCENFSMARFAKRSGILVLAAWLQAVPECQLRTNPATSQGLLSSLLPDVRRKKKP